MPVHKLNFLAMNPIEVDFVPRAATVYEEGYGGRQAMDQSEFGGGFAINGVDLPDVLSGDDHRAACGGKL